MTTAQIAHRLETLCRQGDFRTAVEDLYASDAVSIEPEASQGFEKETHGKDNILQKGDQFSSMVDTVHGIDIRDTTITGNTFALVLTMDVTMKGRPRATWEELCVYQVKDGKIISEQFFM